MARSLNRVELIGNLTRDPELRYTPNGTAVCSFGLATNRSWTTDTGEKHEETEFHNIVSWNKLAELCSQFLVKGRKIYVEGRLATRQWTGQDGAQRTRVEIVINDMILLDSKRPTEEKAPAQRLGEEENIPKQTDTKSQALAEQASPAEKKQVTKKKNEEQSPNESGSNASSDVAPDDIPF